MRKKTTKIQCEKCGQYINPGIMWRHKKFCGQFHKKDKEKKLNEEWKQDNGKYKCPFCDKQFSVYGIYLHIWKKHTKEGKLQNPNIGYENGTRIIWNKDIQLSEEHKNNISKANKGKHKRKLTKEEKKHLSDVRIESIKTGRAKRWNTISGNSYPEKYFEQVLLNEGIKFKKQYHINDGKRNYFLDFYLEDKIDLEIDGTQHQNKDRIISDKRRDEFVNSLGIKVFRINWKNPNIEEGQNYLREKIKELKKEL